MLGEIVKLFSPADFVPRGSCRGWTQGLIHLFIITDFAIFGAYTAIPCILVYFARKRKGLPFHWVFLLFAAFIVCCGVTHCLGAIEFYIPVYRLGAVANVTTAIVSWAAAISLFWAVPQALKLKSEAELEIAVHDRTAELRQVMDCMPQMVWTSDPHGAITYYNLKWCDYTGYLETDVSSDIAMSRWKEAMHPDDRRRVVDEWKRSLEQGEVFECQYRIRRHDGEYRWHLARSVPVRGIGGEIDKWYGTLTDIDDQKAAATQLEEITRSSEQTTAELQRTAEALKRADAAKDDFLAMLGHELRSPIQPLLTSLHAVRQMVKPDGKVGLALNIMDRQAGNMAHLIDDLLDVSRITRGKVQLRTEKLNLNVIIRRAVETVSPHMELSRHDLGVHESSEPVWVTGDPSRLEQVFVNLLGNAAKYTGARGRIVVAIVREGSMGKVTVQDNGIGIEPAKLKDVFGLFTQEGRSLDRSQGGMGLGLSLVRSLLAMHNGSVEAYSAGLGEGSTFTVVIPLGDPPDYVTASPPPPPPKVKSKGCRPCRMLVVDDNRDGAVMMKMALEHMGMIVEVAFDGEEAVRKFEQNKPEVVVLDIGLPVMNGYQVAQAIRQMEEEKSWKKAVLFALSGYGQSEDKSQAIESGCDRHVTKPASANEICQVLADYFPT